MRWRWAWTCQSAKEELREGAELSHAHSPSVSFFARTQQLGLRPPLGVYLFTSGLRQLLPLFPVSGPAPWVLFPAPSGSESACVTMVRSPDWLESAVMLQLRTSFPRHYKKCCTAAASLRPSELEMQLLGSLEATELEAEAAGEVRAM